MRNDYVSSYLCNMAESLGNLSKEQRELLKVAALCQIADVLTELPENHSQDISSIAESIQGLTKKNSP
ncbi:hypothetical protein [Synechocystis sp. CACIAM 05]|uniref:hypothetical protein n=1 Tax=Synechocystis sp. CACIAM 05 TaxID=1933929 RepID=UPI0013916F7C|nr:hypothetical protein [Synechocystis sp. CACIAM 05]